MCYQFLIPYWHNIFLSLMEDKFGLSLVRLYEVRNDILLWIKPKYPRYMYFMALYQKLGFVSMVSWICFVPF